VLNMGVELRGRAAPASTPRSGADALEAAAPLLRALYDYRDWIGQSRSETPGIGAPTMAITEMAAGEGPWTTPGRTVLSIDRRVLPEESVDQVEAEMTNMIGRSVARVPGVVCRVRRRRLLAGVGPELTPDAFVAALTAALTGVLDAAPETYGVSRETAARFYAAAGVPVVLFGAGSHFDDPVLSMAPDESLALDDLRVCTEVLALTLADYLRAPPAPPGAAKAADAAGDETVNAPAEDTAAADAETAAET
ncbi:MAG: peptidase dimerization domain-containing protein, partial [Rhodospirillaceae bacterium]